MNRSGAVLFSLFAMAAASPANASVTFTTGNNLQAGEEIVIFADQGPASTVTGYSTTVPANSLTLSGTTGALGTTTTGNQLAVAGDLVQAPAPIAGEYLLTVDFTPSSPLDLLIFETLAGSGQATYTVTTDLGNVYTFSQTLGSSDFLTIDPAGGEALTNVTISDTSGLGYVTAFGAIFLPAAVPEPATWAMMLVGFASIGMALRRSRRGRSRFSPTATNSREI